MNGVIKEISTKFCGNRNSLSNMVKSKSLHSAADKYFTWMKHEPVSGLRNNRDWEYRLSVRQYEVRRAAEGEIRQGDGLSFLFYRQVK